MSEHTQRTLKALKGLGYFAAVVEKWVPGARVRRDLFGIIDILALAPGIGLIGVQSTGEGFSEHHRHLTQDRRKECLKWLSGASVCHNCGALVPVTRLELWGWRKIKEKRGGKAFTYQPRVHVYTIDDFIDPLEL